MIAPATRWILATLTLLATLAATAQGEAPGPFVRPDDSRMTAPRPPADDATLSTYRRYDPESALADWRAANDEVGRLGGFMGHMRPDPAGHDHSGAATR